MTSSGSSPPDATISSASKPTWVLEDAQAVEHWSNADAHRKRRTFLLCAAEAGRQSRAR